MKHHFRFGLNTVLSAIVIHAAFPVAFPVHRSQPCDVELGQFSCCNQTLWVAQADYLGRREILWYCACTLLILCTISSVEFRLNFQSSQWGLQTRLLLGRFQQEHGWRYAQLSDPWPSSRTIWSILDEWRSCTDISTGIWDWILLEEQRTNYHSEKI